jgi:hypothetical protein
MSQGPPVWRPSFAGQFPASKYNFSKLPVVSSM